jgi:hypothetical protein
MIKLTLLTLATAILVFSNDIARAQACCTTSPTSETTTDFGGGAGNLATVSYFNQVLQGGTGNYGGWTVTEFEGATGSDGCWNQNVNPAYVPEYPSVDGSSWSVFSDNHWFPDEVGWLAASVNYIRQNSPMYSNTPLIPNFPCGYMVYQNLFIVCPGGTAPGENYDNTTQTGTIYSTYVQNIREGVGSVINY